MADVVIKAENLGKKYTIGHQAEAGDGYLTLRDSLAKNARVLWQKTSDLARGKPVIVGDTLEEIWALKDVNFEIQRGEAVGIIGRNGAGKSTLLKILSRITEPSAGRVTIKGRVASLLEVGTGFHPELTGRENIYLNGAILGMTRAEVKRKFDEIVDFAEVEKFLDTPVKRYSSGMYVRLAFAVAAHLEPEILVVDEVLAVGDAQFQKKCLGKMGDVAAEGRTVLFVSHNLGAIRKLCQRGILLTSGHLIATGEVNSAIDSYLNAAHHNLLPCINLPEMAKNYYGEELGYGRRLSFHSMAGVLKAEYRLWEPWKIRLEFDILRPLGHVVAAVGLQTVEGISLATYWSQPAALVAGRYQVEFICNLPLKSCNITAIVGLSEFEITFYYSENQGFVSISEVSTVEQPFRSLGAGVLLTDAQATIEYLGELN